jgi:hypothetical protein
MFEARRWLAIAGLLFGTANLVRGCSAIVLTDHFCKTGGTLPASISMMTL